MSLCHVYIIKYAPVDRIGHRHPDPRPPFDAANGSRYRFGQIELVFMVWNRFSAWHRNRRQLIRCSARISSVCDVIH